MHHAEECMKPGSSGAVAIYRDEAGRIIGSRPISQWEYLRMRDPYEMDKVRGEPYVAHSSLVRVYLGSGNFTKLVDLYLRSLEMNFPNEERLVWDMTVSARDAGKLPKLLSILEEKYKYRKNPFLAYALSVGYCLSGDNDKAIIFCKNALELRPDTEKFYYWLGWFYGKKKMYPEAISSYEKAKALAPKNYLYYEQIALAYIHCSEKKEDKMRAIAIIKEALKNCPDEPDLFSKVYNNIYYDLKNLGLRDIEIEDMLKKHRIIVTPE